MYSRRHTRLIEGWLLVCLLLVAAMIVLGGVTRLTGSGLSMVDWRPISGVMPPLSQSDWDTVFRAYQQSPEYLKVNFWIDLTHFKRLFWFEYVHRMLGRVIGIAFSVPLLLFSISGRLSRPLLRRLCLLFVLGGLQGLLGWYMVKSGLVDVPAVSPYRLAAHWSLAILIFSILLWSWFGFWQRPVADSPQWLRRSVTLVLLLLCVMLLSGAFVAATKAGYVYNTFPKMGDYWVPPSLWLLEPGWNNVFINPVTVQWIHRLLALIVMLVLLTVVSVGWYCSNIKIRWWLAGCVVAVVLQVSIGISVLLLQVPIVLASIHQVVALMVLTMLLGLRHVLSAAG